MKKTPLIPIAISLIGGIVIGDAVGGRVTTWLCVAIGLFVVAVAAGRGARPWARWLQTVTLLATAMAMGGTLISLQEHGQERTLPEEVVDWKGVIVSEPQVRGKVLRADVLITEGPWRRPVKVRAAILRDTLTGHWQRLQVGDGLEAFSRMEPLTNYRSGNFDYVRWQRVHGYCFTTFIYYRNWQKTRVSLRTLSTLERARLRMLRVRHRLLERYRLMGLDEQQYAVVAAMTLGDKTALSQQTKDAYSRTGGSHVLALSGLHLGIIYTILTLLFMGRRQRTLWLSQLVIIVAIWMYALLVGLMPSVVRSATMLTLCSLGLTLGRQGATLNTLALAAVVMAVVNPMVVWDVGFQMSFMAVAAIVVAGPVIMRCFPVLETDLTANDPNRKTRKVADAVKAVVSWLAKWAWGMVVVSVSAQLGTAPLVAYYFGRFSCYFLLTNFIVIPVATVILYGAVAMVVATPWLSLQALIAHGLAMMAAGLNAVLAWAATLPGASLEGLHPSLAQTWLCYVVIGLLVAFLHRVGGKVVPLGKT